MSFFIAYKNQLQSIQHHFGKYIKHLHYIKNLGLTGAMPNEVLYSSLAKDTLKFVDAKYMPTAFC
jgi:hypothetical protein